MTGGDLAMAVCLDVLHPLELGRAVPSVSDLCGVAVLFGRSMEVLVEPLFRDRGQTIQERLRGP